MPSDAIRTILAAMDAAYVSVTRIKKEGGSGRGVSGCHYLIDELVAVGEDLVHQWPGGPRAIQTG